MPWDEINERRRDKAAKAPGVPRDEAACRGETCTAKIRWAVTMDGKRMPVDFTPDPAGDLVRVMVAEGDWRIRVLDAGEEPGPDVHRWTSHYATCPDAPAFRAAGRSAGAARRPSPPRPAAAAVAPAPAPTPAPGTLLAVDGPSLAHRAFYAYERAGIAPAPDGRPLFAVHGFLALLVGIIDKTRPDALVVGFDDRTRSTRRDRYPAYKSGRAERSPDLYAQMDTVVEILGQLGVHVVTPPGLEADDVLGSAAAAAEACGWQCVIATSDKDAFGLITDTTSVLRLVSGLDNAVRMTPAALLDEYGVTPGQYLDYVALVGDKSDALPGVRGIGEKTAVKILAALGSLDAARANRDAVTAAAGKAAAARLITDEALEAITRNRAIMAIHRDVPVDLAACRPTTDPGTVAAVMRQQHLQALATRVAAALCPPPAAPSSTPRQRGHLTVVSDQPPLPATVVDQPAPPLVHADPAPVCPDCGKAAAAVLPLAQLDDGAPVLTGDEVLVDAAHPSGDLVAVRVGDVWAVRRIPVGEYYLRPDDRRRAHYCQVYPFTCPLPDCGDPARLYAAGPRCDRHVPSTPAPVHAGEPRADA